MENLNERFLKARRQVIAADFKNLNEMQRRAVMTTAGPLLLLAGAGSGKTTVIVSRIANLIRYGSGSDSMNVPATVTEDDVEFLERFAAQPDTENYDRAVALCREDPVEPWRILAITFTNKAADEMKDRLIAKLGPEAEDIWAMTFHAACVRILRRDIERLGISRNFTIYDTADSQSVMKRILKDLNMDDKTYPYRSVLAVISSAKDAMQTPDDMQAEAEKRGDFRRKAIAGAYREYVRRLRDAGALDFDDLMLYTVHLLLKDEEVRAYYQRRFKHVLIDEYQDTNHLQYLFASTLAGGHNNICVVGDDDQSIYKFRGATIENILNFEKQFKDAKTIRLEQNYRSTGNILGAANAVISNNIGRKGKELWTDKNAGEKLLLYVSENESDEAGYVASRILEGFGGGRQWREYAVLYRMNAQSNQLEYAFKRHGIPYRVIGGMRFFDRAEIKDVLAYLCVVANPDDDLRLMRIVNEPARGIGTKTLETVREIAAANGISAFKVMEEAASYPELARSAAKLGAFTGLIRFLREEVGKLPLDEFYDLLLEKTGYVAALQEKNTQENTSRIENVQEFRTNITHYMASDESGDLNSFLDEISLYTDMEELTPDSDCVVLMTMHSAKGLEFPTVFIVGAEDGIFPGLRAIGEQDEIEEERRLCYVAMTRAREQLIFTAARRRMLFGKTTSNKTSRFVAEIPDAFIHRPAEPKRPLYEDYMERTGWRGNDWEDRPDYRARNTARASASGSTGSSASGSTQRSAASGATRYPVKAKPAANALPAYEVGDRIRHKTFGTGTITAMRTAGSDALIEIAFDNSGTKKMMLKTASAFMTKEN